MKKLFKNKTTKVLAIISLVLVIISIIFIFININITKNNIDITNGINQLGLIFMSLSWTYLVGITLVCILIYIWFIYWLICLIKKKQYTTLNIILMILIILTLITISFWLPRLISLIISLFHANITS